MSVALYVALEKEVPGFDASSVCGKRLEKAQARLDGIAKENGLTPLGDFISMAPEDVRAFYEDMGGMPERWEPPAEEWFDPADGLRTVRGLLSYLRDNLASVKQARGVCDDLEAAAEVLAAAKEHGVRFHLAIDF
jgi:hypothetical protein